MKILIVEDDFASRRILQKYLSSFQCDVAVDGKEALEAFSLAWKEGKPYRFIFLDILLPGMDGKEVLRRIRAVEDEKKLRRQDRVKVVMTTALNNTANVMEAIECQCDDYLVKPVQKSALMEKIMKLRFTD